ncbi:MAG: peptidylprolyl isomerase [Bacilli bacterium]|nr:peptidylprolyl isomerase [Bacilli bacterium]
MKKSKFFIGLSAAFVAFTSLMSCSGTVRAKDHVILTIDGEEFTAEELFGDMKVSEAAAKEMFDAVYRVAVRKYFTAKEREEEMKEVTKDTKIKMSGQKDIAQSNADKNGTSYAEEWQKILDSNGVEDEDELYDKFEYEIEKNKFDEDFYENDDYKNFKILRDGGKFREDTEEIQGYLKEKSPYHVRHILVKVSAAKDDPCTGEITESEANKLSKVITELANGTKDFGWVANMYSDDTGSKDKYGDLGIMDRDTSFVNEFKLGTYLYESFFSSATSGQQSTSRYGGESAETGLGLTKPATKGTTAADYAHEIIEKVQDPTNHGSDNFTIGQIPYEAALALGSDDYKVTYTSEVTKTAFGNYEFSKLNERIEKAGGTIPQDVKENAEKPKYFPRNIIFNKYFNKNNIMVITPSTFHGTNEVLAATPEQSAWITNIIGISTDKTKTWRKSDDEYLCPTNDEFKKLPGFSFVAESKASSNADEKYFKDNDNVLADFDGDGTKGNTPVLRDENGRVIFVFRSGTSSESSNEDTGYQGIHFVCIERSPFIANEYDGKTGYLEGETGDPKDISVDRQEYFTNYYPTQTGGKHPHYYSVPADQQDDDKNRLEKFTYSNYFPAKKPIDKKARADDLAGKVKAYDPNINTYIYNYLVKNGSINFSEDAEKLGINTIIDSWIELQREDSKYQTEDKWNTTWKDYCYRLEQTTEERKPKLVGEVGDDDWYKGGTISEAAAFAYTLFDLPQIKEYFGTGGAFNE